METVGSSKNIKFKALKFGSVRNLALESAQNFRTVGFSERSKFKTLKFESVGFLKHLKMKAPKFWIAVNFRRSNLRLLNI